MAFRWAVVPVAFLTAALAAETPPKPADGSEPPPVSVKKEIQLGGRTLAYTATSGSLPLKNEAGETEASIFFIAYTVDAPAGAPPRPLMFSFNGGPGSASLWLHLGALGPKRVVMRPDGSLPAPPYTLATNEFTWLGESDLVFIDPVGTGYSRARKPDQAKRYFGVKGDIESVGEFIRLYLTRYERWNSPLFLVGESYGTTRAAGLSGYLIDRGIAFNGILLISSILNFQTARFARGNDLPYQLFLPTYTATAWYHKKLGPDLQKDLRKTLAESELFALGEYALALARGDSLTPSERQAVLAKLSRLTGLESRFLDENNLRIEIQRFTKQLLRDRKRTVGRLDSRITGSDGDAGADTPEFDPSLTAIRPPYTAAFNHYVRSELGYKSDLVYYVLGGGIGPWDWGSAGNGYADTAESLRAAFSKNPHMRLFVGSGYFDLATPYFATEYTLRHMGLDPSLKQQIDTATYEAGHMMYIHAPSLAKLKTDVSAFLTKTLAVAGK